MELDAAKEKEIIDFASQADHTIMLMANGLDAPALMLDQNSKALLHAHFDWIAQIGEGDVNHLALMLIFFLQKNPKIRAAFDDFYQVDVDFGNPKTIISRD
ncbi:hypothetical protein LMC02_10005 [Limosilactobacillus reuteri]|uniref:hypothetical protein n=1 Tax=Limosilactobacillus reuteri TaxID=1598 RepID=UPI001E336690|nr:hypothetical protein [Limosilactobacillus reuteri]MCC4500321.1 hypothetical protein [Limosilactobacillus reuteri]MCC4500646.1 hypothetical protein [Limosilactobacillus reuteri]